MGAFAILALMVFRVFVPRARDRSEKVAVVNIADLANLTRHEAVRNIHFALNGTPTAVERAWQHALSVSGSTVTWSGRLTPIALSAHPVAAPGASHSVAAYAARGTAIKLRDDISLIDSVTTKSDFLTLPLTVVSGRIRAIAGGDSASVTLLDSAVLKRVLVLGRAGWETKFVLAALEEAGWQTDALVFIAPGVVVKQGVAASIDTAYYSAVVALDETAAPRVNEIRTFVRSGGGLIIGEAAARSPEFTQLRVSISAPAGSRTVSAADTVSRSSAPISPLQIRPDAIPIEQRGRDVAVAGRRIDFGRVVQIAFTDTWRWRLQGNLRSMLDHRDWWSGVVSKVANSRRVTNPAVDDRAPYAGLVEIAGAPISIPQVSKPISERSNQLFWIIALFALLLAELTSRRLRGVR